MSELECPVDFVTVNENKIRFVALLVFLLSVSFLFAENWVVPLLLTIDFYLRGFNCGKYSPLFWLAGVAEKKIPLPHRPTDRGPKRFAAQIGFVMSLMLFVFSVTGVSTVAIIVASVLVLFSFLESALGFCAGCYIYTYFGKYLPKRN